MKTKKKRDRPGKPRKRDNATLGGMGLDPEEDAQIIAGLERLDISLRRLQRGLIRSWLAGGAMGVLNVKDDLISIDKLGK